MVEGTVDPRFITTPDWRNTGHFITLKILLIQPSRYYGKDFMG